VEIVKEKIKETQERINDINDFKYRQLRRAPQDPFAKSVFMWAVDLVNDDELNKWKRVLRWQNHLVSTKSSKGAIDEDDVVLARQRNIVEVAKEYVDVVQMGSRFKCACPFHDEKEPSLTFYPDNNSYYCYGCGVGGDVINFYMKINNCDFVTAVKGLI